MNPYSPQSKLAAYRSVSAHGAVADTHPHAWYSRCSMPRIERMNAARGVHRAGRDPAHGRPAAQRVILIAELRGSLDLQKGGPLAQNLSNLYEYMTRRLMHANLNSDADAVTEVVKLLAEIRGAWAAIGPEVRGQSQSSAA